ncbi:hypothetical protein [Paenibacillus sp. MMS20-IR301]|uniref:hypothetical protein n=1 Tax=Paenibacillus sp. MMS20-IR301 TaxID=2895946 RepID=UPI0028EADC90|nr:hypothetical protein [Paenibacillus sp. MMS20-IR301]WNS44645.1 hypothetical protein LOS79_05055 [Paenibacillus sp. MMS20-IR301]
MKGILLRGLLLLCLAGLLAGCSTSSGKSNSTGNSNTIIMPPAAGVTMTLDGQGQYTGFDGMAEKETIEEAAAAGNVVIRDLEVVAGQEAWDQFIEAADSGINAGLRIAQFFSDEPGSPYYNDLFYQDGKYYLFDNTAKTLVPEPFSYLLTLRGKTGRPLKDSGMIILTDDNRLTFDRVIAAQYSSSTEVINSLPPYTLIRYLVN